MLRIDNPTLKERVSEVEKVIREEKLDALVVYAQGSALGSTSKMHGYLRYLCNYDGHNTPAMLILRPDREPVLVTAINAFLMRVQTREMLWFLYLLLVLETILWALFEPARTSVIPNITRGPETLVANALSSTTWSFTLAVGSAVGGVLAVAFGRDTVFVLDALSFIGSALLLRRMCFIEPHVEDLPPLRAKDLADFSPITDGVKYVAKDPRRMATMFVKCGLGLMGTNWVLLPIFGTRIYPMAIHGLDPNSAGMLGMSVLMGCRGIGALLGPFIASTWTGLDERNFRRGILCGFALGFLGYCTLGLSQNLAVACLGIVIAHSGGAIAWVFSTTLLQMKTDDKFRGRVFSAEFALSMLTLSIVSYSAGLLADDGMSVRTLAICTGFLVLIPGILWAFAQRLWREPVSA